MLIGFILPQFFLASIFIFLSQRVDDKAMPTLTHIHCLRSILRTGIFFLLSLFSFRSRTFTNIPHFIAQRRLPRLMEGLWQQFVWPMFSWGAFFLIIIFFFLMLSNTLSYFFSIYFWGSINWLHFNRPHFITAYKWRFRFDWWHIENTSIFYKCFWNFSFIRICFPLMVSNNLVRQQHYNSNKKNFKHFPALFNKY